MQIQMVPAPKLGPEDYQRCRSLNAREDGRMQREITVNRDSNQHFIYMAKDGDKLLGWALVFRRNWEKEPRGHFYVRKTHRGQGIGKQLMKEVLNSHKKIRVMPHDEKSGIFFCEFRTSLVVTTGESWIKHGQAVKAHKRH